MKNLLPLLILATLGTAAAKADTISIVFDKPTQIAIPGSTLVFNGTITNLTNATVYLNSDYLTLTGPNLKLNDQFFSTVPFSLAAGAKSGDIELFDVTVPANPSTADSGPGTYGLEGGPDSNATNNLGSTSFNVNPVSAPEIDPSLAVTPLLLITGSIAVLRGRRRFPQAV